MAVKKNGTIIGHLLSIVGLLVIYEERREDTMHSDRRSLLACLKGALKSHLFISPAEGNAESETTVKMVVAVILVTFTSVLSHTIQLS